MDTQKVLKIEQLLEWKQKILNYQHTINRFCILGYNETFFTSGLINEPKYYKFKFWKWGYLDLRRRFKSQCDFV